MHRIVIAMGSDDLGAALENELNHDFSVVRCFDGITAEELIRCLHPDILLIDLALPLRDGITVLNQCGAQLPPIVLATTAYDGIGIRELLDSGRIDRVFKIPCDVQTIICSISKYAEQTPAGSRRAAKPDLTEILTKLGIPSGRLGFRQLEKAIQLYAQNPNLVMCKELYPMVLDSTSVKDGKIAEHTMRSVIKAAWLQRDKAVWDQYFPAFQDRYPNNRAFIARLAQEIK